MSGKTIRVLKLTTYDFTTLLAGVVTAEEPVAIDIDISGFREITFLIRVHAANVASGGTTGKITAVVRASAPTNEDPASFFRETISTSVDIVTVNNAPALYRLIVPANMGSWLTIFLKATQNSGTSGAALSGTFSIDVSMKE